MSKCGKCCGSCGSCGGNSLELTAEELDILRQLGQIPFLPVGRKADEMTPVYPEDSAWILQCLEKRELISIDYGVPLKGFHDPKYEACPVKGSFALTARGQQVLDILEIQGLDE